ncbi:unnamed protein product [Rhizoctonia solani]|uniref:Uncharacterized protein n=1 Tax=Rhizoctonia solani TaxID=456999 RepID=A0A8H3B9D0_9AGAM|nr:unnamed protein product [Rhizoctonia solani]
MAHTIQETHSNSKPIPPRNEICQLALYLISCLVSIVILVSGLDSIHKLFGNSSAEAQAKPEGGEGNILRLKIDNLNPQCSIDSKLSSPSELASSIPDTPACKGFPFETNFLDELRGECRYFIASIQLNQGCSEYSIFSLDPGQRKISHISESLPLEYVDRSFDSVINFTIDDLTYQWDTIYGTLLVGQPQAGPGTPILQWSDVQLYTTLEKAKELVDSVQGANLGTPSSSNPVSSPPADSNTHLPSNVTGEPSTFPETEVFYLPHATGYFGPSPSKENIDEWVDQAVSNYQIPRDGTRLKCPEAGCTTISRRPHALKVGTYMHRRG